VLKLKTTIISLGGSVINPGEIDTVFLDRFRELISNFIKKNYKFAIYCGGGALARDLQKKAKDSTQEELDWVGIKATKINAQYVRDVFGENAEKEIIEDPTKKFDFKKDIIIAAGWKPGWSTDYDAVLLAENIGADTVLNVTNVDYVYDKNPKEHSNAKPIEKISWKEFRKLTGDKWKPGLNIPFDPIAAKEAEKLGLKVIVIGNDLENLENCLDGKKFKGTVITR